MGASARSQTGAAALAIALVLIVVATVITLAVAQIAAGDQRGLSNELRRREAVASAELGLERALAYLHQQRAAGLLNSTAAGGWMEAGRVRWRPCVDGDIALPCGDGRRARFDSRWTASGPWPALLDAAAEQQGRFAAYAVTRAAAGSPAPEGRVYQLFVEGRSRDGSAQALVGKAIRFRPLLAHLPDAPLIGAGALRIAGALTLVAHADARGVDQPLSVWAAGDAALGEQLKSCRVGDYLSTAAGVLADGLMQCSACRCPATGPRLLSRPGVEGVDVLDIDQAINGGPASADPNADAAQAPLDAFDYLFALPRSGRQLVESLAQRVASCNELGPASQGLIWHGGACVLPAGRQIGSAATPVLLLVDGELRFGAGGQLFGLVLVTASAVHFDGGASLIGALVADRELEITSVDDVIRYEPSVLQRLAGDSAPALASEVPGSWRDFRAP